MPAFQSNKCWLKVISPTSATMPAQTCAIRHFTVEEDLSCSKKIANAESIRQTAVFAFIVTNAG